MSDSITNFLVITLSNGFFVVIKSIYGTSFERRKPSEKKSQKAIGINQNHQKDRVHTCSPKLNVGQKY